jgi:hypothetical protein
MLHFLAVLLFKTFFSLINITEIYTETQVGCLVKSLLNLCDLSAS